MKEIKESIHTFVSDEENKRMMEPTQDMADELKAVCEKYGCEVFICMFLLKTGNSRLITAGPIDQCKQFAYGLLEQVIYENVISQLNAKAFN